MGPPEGLIRPWAEARIRDIRRSILSGRLEGVGIGSLCVGLYLLLRNIPTTKLCSNCSLDLLCLIQIAYRPGCIDPIGLHVEYEYIMISHE